MRASSTLRWPVPTGFLSRSESEFGDFLETSPAPPGSAGTGSCVWCSATLSENRFETAPRFLWPVAFSEVPLIYVSFFFNGARPGGPKRIRVVPGVFLLAF